MVNDESRKDHHSSFIIHHSSFWRLHMTTATATKVGKIVQVIGSTFDAEFDEGHLPEIYHALVIDTDSKGRHLHLTGEVQQHLGGNRVRCVALGSTDGLVRGMKVTDTGAPVTVPVGF